MERRRVRLARAVLRSYRLPRGKRLLFRLLRTALRVPTRPVIALDGRMRMHADLEEYVQRYVFCNGFDDPDVPVLRSLLRPGDRFIDVGANIGLYTLTASEIVGAQGAVHAIEPLEQILGILRANLVLNQVTNVRVHALALAAEEGEALFHPSRNGNLGMGSFSDQGEKATPVRVLTRTLDSLLADGTIDGCDVIKMDIEGAEPLALRGMERTLAARLPRAVLVEVSSGLLHDLGWTVGDTLGPLRRHGYEWHRAIGGGLVRLDGEPRRHENLWAVRTL